MRSPLVSLFAASNELPEGKELEALFDRDLRATPQHDMSSSSGQHDAAMRQVGGQSTETNNAELGFDI